MKKLRNPILFILKKNKNKNISRHFFKQKKKKNERIILNSNENHRSFNKCDEFCKNVLNNKKYKEEIKFNINELDKLINSLNLFKGIQNNKLNEIRNLINEMKNKTNDRIIKEKNSL